VTDVDAARRFVQGTGRLLDRRRLAHLLDSGSADAVVAAVAAYANPDGGYAGVLEPDVRTLASQPIGLLAALDVLGEVGAGAPRPALDWLAATANPDGGLPFHLPAPDGAPQAPWMRADPASSLHMTAAVAAAALRLGARSPAVDAAVVYCRAELATGRVLTAHETRYAIDLLDAAGDVPALQAWAPRVPADGRLPVEGGAAGEALGPLTLSPRSGRPARALLDPGVVEAELDRLEQGQREDGGWEADWLAWSPVAAVEWRARLTVDALTTLAAHGRPLSAT
jgi:hypothetical protein